MRFIQHLLLKYHRELVVVLILLMYITSLTQPVFRVAFTLDVKYPHEWPNGIISPDVYFYYDGWYVFLKGWLGIFQGTIGWYANIGLMATIVLYLKRHSKCLKWSVGSLFVALTSFTFRKIIDIDGGLDDSVTIVGLESGFYIWLSTFFVLLMASYIQFRSENKCCVGSDQ